MNISVARGLDKDNTNSISAHVSNQIGDCEENNHRNGLEGGETEPEIQQTEGATSRNSGEGLAVVLHSSAAATLGENVVPSNSCPSARMSVSREGSWMVRSAAARKKVRQMVSSHSNSLSEARLINCPVSFWLKDVDVEARNIWKEGKELGVSFLGNEEEVISRIVQLEQRDARGTDTGATAVC